MKNRLCITSILLLCLTWFRIDAAEIVIQESPVRIVTSSDRDIFPKSWFSAQINAQAEVLQESEIERSKKILNKAMKKYPKRVLASNLEAVYVLHRLKFNGINAGGTNSRRNIYIANPGYSDGWIERAFHEEFSSILLRNFPQYLNRNAWKKANPESFKYGESGVHAIRQKKARKSFDTSLHVEGFLCEYAKSTLENDFNSMTGQLFFGDDRFWSIVSKHRRIKEKSDLVITFYHKIDPAFSKFFFLSLAKRKQYQSASTDADKPRR